MVHRMLTALLTSLVIALGVTALAAPASADRATVDDPRDNEPGIVDLGDIDRVVVRHTKRALLVRVHFYVDAYDSTHTWIDTGGGKKPDFVIRLWSAQSGGSRGVFRTDRWGSPYNPGQERVKCANWRGRYIESGDHDDVVVRVPRRCLRTDGVQPARLRIAVASGTDECCGAYDWSPKRRTFGPWLKAG